VADLEALKRALINADKAGDEPAARVLAAEIRKQMAGGNQPDAPAASGMSDRAKAFARDAGLPEDPNQRSGLSKLAGMTGAMIDSAAQGLTFNTSDEIEAGLKTGFGLFGDYGQAVENVRGRMEYNQGNNPVTYLAGGIAGGLTTGAGMLKSGLSLVPRFANSGLRARMGAGALEGAAYGTAYGIGGGEGLGGRVEGAGIGAVTGGAVGGAVPVAGTVLRGAGEMAYDAIAPRIRGVLNPEGEAARRVGAAFQRDAQMQQFPLSRADEAAGFVPGQDVRNFDRGGETVRTLVRSVTNQSPESRGVIERTVSDRFAGQGERLRNVIERVAGGKIDDIAYQEQLASRQQATNRAAYERAWKVNFGPQHSPVFDELLTRVPPEAVRNAMRVAKAEGRPFGEQLVASIDDAAGTVTFSRQPSMREWHYIQRGLRSASDSAYRSGVGEVGTAYKALHREVLDAMDNANPAYKTARQGAAAFFQADDAIDAGRKYVRQNMDVRQATAAFQKMSAAEQDAFKIGFAGELIESLRGVSERRNVIS
jgi:hypothetical protein